MKFLQIIQMAVAILLVLSILLQSKGSGLSGVFGGSDGVYRTKRGMEKTLFSATIILAISFFVVSLVGILL